MLPQNRFYKEQSAGVRFSREACKPHTAYVRTFFTLVPDRSFDCSHTSLVFNLRKNKFFYLRACEEIQVSLN